MEKNWEDIIYTKQILTTKEKALQLYTYCSEMKIIDENDTFIDSIIQKLSYAEFIEIYSKKLLSSIDSDFKFWHNELIMSMALGEASIFISSITYPLELMGFTHSPMEAEDSLEFVDMFSFKK